MFSVQILAAFALHLWMITQFLQLVDVTKGLIYIHSQGMIHGDLKGVRFQQHESLFYLTEFTC